MKNFKTKVLMSFIFLGIFGCNTALADKQLDIVQQEDFQSTFMFKDLNNHDSSSYKFEQTLLEMIPQVFQVANESYVIAQLEGILAQQEQLKRNLGLTNERPKDLSGKVSMDIKDIVKGTSDSSEFFPKALSFKTNHHEQNNFYKDDVDVSNYVANLLAVIKGNQSEIYKHLANNKPVN